MKAIPKGHTAVMANRVEAPDALDYFPTPPWATRALCDVVLRERGYLPLGQHQTCWEPAAGGGHMAEVLREYFDPVHASDVHDYGRGYAVGTFVGYGLDRAECPFRPDWIITNPPFNLAAAFFERAVGMAIRGVALLLRSNWAEGAARYRTIFQPRPPTYEALFVERVPMVKGRWDPEASTATSYTWFVWCHPLGRSTGRIWIPPGQRKALEEPDDRRRFA
jgi:hypothetical protein